MIVEIPDWLYQELMDKKEQIRGESQGEQVAYDNGCNEIPENVVDVIYYLLNVAEDEGR